MSVLQIFAYISISILIVGTAYRTIKIARMPVHLRWDLYPIPHEKGKARYGGSRYEETNWWTKSAQFSLWNEIKEMAAEIFAIKTLFRHNRGIWYFSLPFHLGLYFSTLFFLLILIGSVMELSGVSISAQSSYLFGYLVNLFTILCGTLAWIFGIFGSCGLLVIRIGYEKYRRFSLRSDYFNLILLLGIFISGLVSNILDDRSYNSLRAFFSALAALGPAPELTFPVKLEILLTSFFFAYLPFTHMTHFVGKFFTYHKVRWQDQPNLAGGEIENEIIEALGQKVSWTASHMGTGRSWAENAAGGINDGTKNDQ